MRNFRIYDMKKNEKFILNISLINQSSNLRKERNQSLNLATFLIKSTLT